AKAETPAHASSARATPINLWTMRAISRRSFPSTTAAGVRTIELASGRRDIERIEIGAAETAFVRQISRERMALEHSTAWREDVRQRARSAALPAADRDDVAVGIEAHALDAAVRTAMVRGERVQHDRVIERAVGADGIGAQLAALALARLAVGDVQRPLVRRQ